MKKFFVLFIFFCISFLYAQEENFLLNPQEIDYEAELWMSEMAQYFTSAGTPWAWGNNYRGQLGNGTNNASNVPVPVSNLTNAISIAGGYIHSLSLKNDGTVWAWGYNWDGELGNGTWDNSNTPVQVLNLSNVISIAGGGFHSIAISYSATNIPKVIPDGTNEGTNPVKVLKNNSDGTELQVIWDDLCSPLRTNIIYGNLSQISSYQISGSKCNISNPDIWEIGSTTNIWFVIVSDDGAGTESSWGTSSSGQRNGTNASGECGNNLRDNSGTCP